MDESDVSGFKSEPRLWDFVVFEIASMLMTEWYLKLGCDSESTLYAVSGRTVDETG